MCKWNDKIEMEVLTTAQSSHTGKEYMKMVGIDRCLVPIIKALNAGGVPTISSCCGHGKMRGIISLKDGRQLVVSSDMKTGLWLTHEGYAPTTKPPAPK